MLLAACVFQVGCIKKMAINAAANALAEQGDTFSAEPDPELAEEAIPFGLKTMESVLASTPRHEGLLLALASGFTSYAYGFVEHEAFEVKLEDLDESKFLQKRAMDLYWRAKAYGFRCLSVDHPDFEARLGEKPDEVMARMRQEDVPKLYWSAAAWGLGIAASNFEPSAVVDLPLVKTMVQRALEIDEDWEMGALHDFMVVLETYLPDGDLERAEQHHLRALELTGGNRVGTHVSYAENIAVRRQDGAAFVEHLKRALQVDLEALPSERLANTISKDRARMLLDRSADLFIDDPLEAENLSMNVSLPPAVSWPSVNP